MEEIGTPSLPVMKGGLNNRTPGGTRFGIFQSLFVNSTNFALFNFLSHQFPLLTYFARARRAALLYQEAWLSYTVYLL